MIEAYKFTITTDATAAGSAVSARPIVGRILEWRCTGTDGTGLFGPGGTATLTAVNSIGGRGDGGTVAAFTAVPAQFIIAPRRLLQTVANGTTFYVAGSASSGVLDSQGIPSTDYITVSVAAGGTSKTGAVYVVYDRDTH